MYIGQLTLESDSLLDRVNGLRLSLVDGNLSLLVSGNVSGGLDDRPGLEGTDSDRRQKRGEEEVVSGGNYNNVEFLSIKVFQERRRTPSGTEDNKGRLARIIVELVSWVNIFLGDCGYQIGSQNYRYYRRQRLLFPPAR